MQEDDLCRRAAEDREREKEMTLGEGKKKVYELLDEYSSGGEITVDDDIELKLADFFDMAQKRVAQVKRILAIKEIKRRDGVTEYAMPSGFGSLYRVWRDGQVTNRYRWKQGKIVIPEDDSAAKIEIEYFKIPDTINADMDDETEFEVDEDAAQAMPYYVAAQHLFPDLVVDYGAYMQEFNSILASLDTRIPGSSGGGGLQNTFFRGG